MQSWAHVPAPFYLDEIKRTELVFFCLTSVMSSEEEKWKIGFKEGRAAIAFLMLVESLPSAVEVSDGSSQVVKSEEDCFPTS